MRTVTEDFKKAYMTGAQKYLTLRFSDGTTLTGSGSGSEIDEGSMTLEQTLCDEEQIHFGLCNAAVFSVRILASSKRYRGLYVYPTISSGGYSMNLGKFRIDGDELTDDRMYRQLTAYDQMTDLMSDDVSGWYAGLNLPMSLKQFRNSLFSYFNNKYGVKQAALKIQGKAVDSLPNDGMTVERTMDSDNPIDGQEVLERICEINGCFGVINEDGDFEYRFLTYDEMLYPADDLYPANDLYPIGAADVIGGDPDDHEASFIQSSLVWQEYEYQPITKLQIHQTENDIGAIVGEDGNAYEVYDNFLVYGMGADDLNAVAENLLGTLKKTISYTPAKVAVRGRPWVQTGDLLNVVYKGRTITYPLLHRTMEGITALKDTYEAQGQEYFSFNVTGTNHEIYGILRKTFEITKSVDGLETKATELRADLTEFESTITQTAQEISARVSKNEEDISQLTITAQQISIEVSNKTTHAAIVAAINDNTSSVKIDADKIDLTGYVTFTSISNPQSQTFIDGNNIKTGTLSADAIVTAWNGKNPSVYLDASGLHAYGTVFDGGGVEIYNNGSHIGAIGGTQWLGNESYKGIAFNLDAGFMVWGWNGGSGSTYWNKLIYDSTGGAGYASDSLNLGCNFDCHGYEVKSANLTDVRAGGYSAVTGTYWVSNSNGGSASLVFTNGILTGTSGF